MANTTIDAVRLTPTEDQVAFRSVLKDFLAAEFPEARVRELMETDAGYESAAWRRTCDLGLTGLHVPEEYGGTGGGISDLAVAFEELGRRLVGVPAFSTIALATTALLRSDDQAMSASHLPHIVEGTTTATLGWASGSAPAPTAVADGDSYLVTGELAAVLDGHTADLILVVAETADGTSLFALDGSEQVTASLLPMIDLTRKFAHVQLTGARAQLVGRAGEGGRVLAETLDVARVCLAAEQLGGAGKCLEEATEYARTRHQFGRAIGSFQAIKHQCAEMFVECESLRSAVAYAASVGDQNGPDFTRAAALAKAAGSDTFRNAANGNVQIHGGIGFTWEHPAHLYLKRAKSDQSFLGNATSLRNLIAETFGW